ncbi:zinc-binding alcohol dehydrogenase family protein [Amycolatopsis sp. A133]|uniref:zinc-binding alcohol dehydrogenase family protein n=1 Tax=Amycolatopsis sp. A133 TaxID=3064472 RepID=UPI0027FDDDBA|nr:zinc-binding alcohol dehydrogenase family protein [Amycolatopsis sp. A133]MDQ7808433.1 zinc-binding alcohol dehydrogenase family protein [Amycolatopsis sp. A133]
MRAVVLREPGPVENLELTDLPLPEPEPGWVRIAVKAFGLNRSELHTRLGLAEGVTFPRVPGIEAVGVVDADPGGEFAEGQQVATMMGGMGRTFDGGYAEYTVVPKNQVIPFRSELPWEVIGQVPETLQTAYGSLTTGLDLQAGQALLIRGGTSALGFAAATLAKDLGATVLATTRQPGRIKILRAHGVDHPLLDDGNVAEQVRKLVPGGVDAALELVGTPTLPDTLDATRVHGTVCFAGMLSNQWTISNFYPIGYLPAGVRLTAYGGEADDLPASVLQRHLDRIADGEASLGPAKVYPMAEIRQAHDDLEHNRTAGKLVVLTGRAEGAAP